MCVPSPLADMPKLTNLDCELSFVHAGVPIKTVYQIGREHWRLNYAMLAPYIYRTCIIKNTSESSSFWLWITSFEIREMKNDTSMEYWRDKFSLINRTIALAT